MAPDLNSVSRSPHTTAAIASNATPAQLSSPSQTSGHHSRRTSAQMLPPPIPRNDSLPASPRAPTTSVMDNTGVGIGPGPIRHPRPLTAAELHLELEKEQESIVNRLTRELSALRAQTASVASTTSSTSDHFFSSSDPYTSNTGTSTTITSTSTRRHRSSSNLSARSARSIRDNLASTANTSVSGVAAPRDQNVQASSRPSMEIARPEISRQNSTSASGYRSSSLAASPHLSQNAYSYSNRHSLSSSHQGGPGGGVDASGQSTYPRSPSFSSAVAAARYEEAALHRAELEAVKRENETLRARVKELERSLASDS